MEAHRLCRRSAPPYPLAESRGKRYQPQSRRPVRLCARIARAVSGVSTSASAISTGRQASQPAPPVPAQLANGIVSASNLSVHMRPLPCLSLRLLRLP